VTAGVLAIRPLPSRARGRGQHATTVVMLQVPTPVYHKRTTFMSRFSDSGTPSSHGAPKHFNESIPGWNLPPLVSECRPRKVRQEELFSPHARDTSGYDLWGRLRAEFTTRVQFTGRLRLEVPAGAFVCKPLLAQLVKLPADLRPCPHYCLVTVVAAGSQRGKLIPVYWPYPGEVGDAFDRDCKATGLHPNMFDFPSGFTSGGLVVRVDEVRRGKSRSCEVVSVMRLAGLIPEDAWPTDADKPSSRRTRSRAVESTAAIAAATALHSPETGDETSEQSEVAAPPD